MVGLVSGMVGYCGIPTLGGPTLSQSPNGSFSGTFTGNGSGLTNIQQIYWNGQYFPNLDAARSAATLGGPPIYVSSGTFPQTNSMQDNVPIIGSGDTTIIQEYPGTDPIYTSFPPVPNFRFNTNGSYYANFQLQEMAASNVYQAAFGLATNDAGYFSTISLINIYVPWAPTDIVFINKGLGKGGANTGGNIYARNCRFSFSFDGWNGYSTNWTTTHDFGYYVKNQPDYEAPGAGEAFNWTSILCSHWFRNCYLYASDTNSIGISLAVTGYTSPNQNTNYLRLDNCIVTNAVIGSTIVSNIIFLQANSHGTYITINGGDVNPAGINTNTGLAFLSWPTPPFQYFTNSYTLGVTNGFIWDGAKTFGWQTIH